MKKLIVSCCILFLLSGCSTQKLTIDPELKKQSLEYVKLIDNAKANKTHLSSIDNQKLLIFTDTTQFKNLTQKERDVMVNILELANSNDEILYHTPEAAKQYDATLSKLKSILGDF